MEKRERNAGLFDGYPALLSKEEASKAIRVSKSTLSRLIATGKVEAVKPTKRRTLVTRTSLERLCVNFNNYKK